MEVDASRKKDGRKFGSERNWKELFGFGSPENRRTWFKQEHGKQKDCLILQFLHHLTQRLLCTYPLLVGRKYKTSVTSVSSHFYFFTQRLLTQTTTLTCTGANSCSLTTFASLSPYDSRIRLCQSDSLWWLSWRSVRIFSTLAHTFLADGGGGKVST